MRDFCRHVNVFQGNGTIDLPTPERLAATWFFIKAIAGNTIPGAVLPFGKYSCCTYTTAYSAGYGDNYPNTSPWDLRHFKDGAKFYGLSHFHHSGTGALGFYYNYAVTTPFFGNPLDMRGYDILSEDAHPGYYSVLSEGGIRSETTVSTKKVYHRFSFYRESDKIGRESGRIAIDFTNDGLFKISPRFYKRPNEGVITIASPSEVRAEIVLDGQKQYFTYRAEGAKIVSLLCNNAQISGNTVSFNQSEDTYGILLDASDPVVNAQLTVSLLSMDDALDSQNACEGGFDAVAQNALDIWNTYLSRIEIEGASERDSEIFYSNLYHTLVKPCDRIGESPLWSEPDFMMDFCTMWDVYKTQFPLIFTLYPEVSSKIINTIFCFGKYCGAFPHIVVLTKGFTNPSRQSCMIAEHSVCDAFFRGVPADYTGNLQNILNDIHRDSYKPFVDSDKLPPRLTFVIDISDACGAVAEMAERLNRPDIAEDLKKLAGRWIEAYDPQTGLLRTDHDFYEGTNWNHSFRLQRDMDKRIALAGGHEAFTALLDRFFGFTHPASTNTRFEGFNNETDMETPYIYNFAGRHDRLCEVIDAANRFMFTTGRGGIPGNNDSGGLSSCYIWNTIGVFPVSGQDLMIVGTPRFPKTTLHLPGSRDFTILREGEGIYVRAAYLDGENLPDFTFKASRMMCGGVLKCEMSETAC